MASADRRHFNNRMKVDNREMGTQQLLDALTDHLALYHRKASSASETNRNTKGALKEKALLWFRSLSIEQRRSALTIFDRSWVALLLQMQRRLAKEGRGYFLVLPDVLESTKAENLGSHASSSSKPEPKSALEEPRKARKSFKTRKKPSTIVCESAPAMALPSLCFRKARGLLARLDEEHAAGELLCHNLELSCSVEAASIKLNWLDVACVSEDLLRDPEQYFATMDTITNGEFFSSVGASQQDSSWEELPWLKNMGYYTMPAFVANKLELVMWSAWLHDEGTYRLPKNLSKELRKSGMNAKSHTLSISAITVCKRYKVFKDRWIILEADARLKMLRLAVARGAKMEVIQAVHSASRSGSEMELREVFQSARSVDSHSDHDTTQFSGFCSYMVGLNVLQSLVLSPLRIALGNCPEASQAADYEPSLCSCLNSADTLPSNIMRRACHVLHEVMGKYMELELLKSESCTSQAAQQKVKKESRRKKSRNSGQNSRKMESGDEVVSGLLRSEEMPKNTTIDLSKSVEEHKNAKIEKCKVSKKKRHVRERLKESNGFSSTMTLNEVRVSSGSTYQAEVKSSHKQTKTVTTLDFPLTDRNGKELSGCQLLTEDHHLLKVELIPQIFDSSQCSESIASNLEPSKTADSLDNPDTVDQGFNRLEGLERALPAKDIDDFHSSEENLPKQKTGVCVSTGDFRCAIKDVANERANADTLLPTNVASTNLDKRHSNCEVSDTQGVSPSPNNLSHTSGLSRSFFPSHMSRERYWESLRSHSINSKNSTLGFRTAHEWPGTFQVHFSRGRSHVVSPATERLHLDVGRNWQQRLQASFVALRNPVMKIQSGLLSHQKWSSNMQANGKSSDCAPMYSNGYAPNRSYSYGFREETAVLQPAFPLPFAGPDLNALARSQDEVRHDDRTPDDTDYDESNYFSGDFDDHEGYIISEEESERQLLDSDTQGEGDYNQYFGGGVMFWNTADYAGTGYSRPPSLSSEDSSWARHEADLSVVLDDIMGFPAIPSSYTSVANPGMVSTSPPPTTYHSGFEHGVPVSGNDFGKFSPLPPAPSIMPEDENSPSDHRKNGSLDGTVPELVSIPVLRPIIVVRDTGRQVSGSESIRYHEARSPHVPRKRRELPWQRRPPSPVLRCVPPSPPPPPPSPVSEFGKRKGLTTARSGSSSPRRWGLVNGYHKEEQDVPFVLSEVLESAWGKRNMREKASIHPISGSLLRERLFTIPPLTVEKDHPDIALPMQTTFLFNSDPSLQSAITRLHNILHKEIEGFCKQVAAENLLRKPSISSAIDKVTHAMQVLWPRSRLKVFGSSATGLALPCSDVDLVVCLPPVRNLEPIKEAGILEGRNGIKETCLQHAARYLADQDWVKSDTLKTIENTTIPIIMLVAHVSPHSYNVTDSVDSLDDLHADGKKVTSFEEGKGPWGGRVDREFVRLDISFEAPSHTGLRTAELVRELRAQFPAITPLALVLKQFLTDRSLDHPYTGGLSSYCLVILITRFLQHQHHLGCPFQQNLGSLLMDFLHFFGCVFDPRRMGICIRGGGMYVSRDRGHSIDPLHIEDPLYPTNNVGRNCFRILQCVKAFVDAYSYIEKVLVEFTDNNRKVESFDLLSNILPSVQSLKLLADMS